MASDIDDILSRAWTITAPGRDKSLPFPRGFWPDLARVAVHLALNRELDFRPTACMRGNYPEPMHKSRQKSRAENTAALLAALDLKGAEL